MQGGRISVAVAEHLLCTQEKFSSLLPSTVNQRPLGISEQCAKLTALLSAIQQLAFRGILPLNLEFPSGNHDQQPWTALSYMNLPNGLLKS